MPSEARVVKQHARYSLSQYEQQSVHPWSDRLDIGHQLGMRRGRNVHVQLMFGVSAEAKAASEGLASLTPQQFRVLTMVCEGLLNKQIAYELSVSEATIKAHVTAIFRKLNVRTRTQAALLLQQLESTSSL